MEKELTPQQKKAIGLLVARDVNGLNYTEISKQVGVSTQALYDWRHDYHFTKELNRQADQIISTYLNDVYRKLGQIVNSKDSHDRDAIKSAEVILKLQGKYSTKIEVTEPKDQMKELLDRLDNL